MYLYKDDLTHYIKFSMEHSDACLACTHDFRVEIEGPKDGEALTGRQQKEEGVES